MSKLTLLTSEFHPFRGGIGVLAQELATAATDLGAEVQVVAPDYLGTRHKAFDATRTFSIRRYRAGPYAGKNMPVYLQQAMLAAKDPDAGRMIAVDSAFLEALAMTRAMHRMPFDTVLHGSEITRAIRSKARKLIGLRRIYGAPNRYFANSNFTRNLLLESMPFVDPDKVIVTYPAANKKWFSAPDAALCKDIVDIDRGPIVVCTGRITPRKGQVALLNALQVAPISADMRKILTVVIAGRAAGPDKAYFEKLRHEAESSRPINVIIRDDLDDDALRALYSVADIFCLPGSSRTSAVEGFGLVFVEAAAQGLPSVAGAVGAVPESVLNGKSGILVPPDDPVALGQVLADLLANPVKLVEMREAARKHASSFSWESFARPFLENE